MSEVPPSMSGKAFASDLRKIREARGISIEQLHDETKIPRSLIDAFEESGLVEHPMFNRVYLRSFVRTYAEVVGISPDVVLESLDQAIEDQYQDRLANEYLGAGPAVDIEQEPEESLPLVSDPEDFDVEAELPADSQGELNQDVEEDPDAEELDAELLEDGSDAEAEELEEEYEVVEEDIQPVKPVIPPPVVRREQQEPLYQPSPPPITPPPYVQESVSPPTSRPPVARRPVEEPEGGRKWLWVVAGVVLLALIGWFVFGRTGVPDPEQVVTAEPADSTANEAAPAAPIAIGDSLDVNIVAAGGPVQDIKVTVDEDLRRPYWIEQGESRLFQAAQRIVIERQLEKVQLQLEGRPYPTDALDDQGRIVITRESAQEFLSQAR